MNPGKSLKARAVRRLGITLAFYVLIVLVPAGSLRFWQAWLFLALMAGFFTFFFVNLLKHDPQLLERRLQKNETEPEQKVFQKLFAALMISSFILAGLDFRFGWSRKWLGPVPVALVVAAQGAVVAGYWLVFWALKTNSFAGSTIEVEAEQKVIDRGPLRAGAAPHVYRHGGHGAGRTAGAGIVRRAAPFRVARSRAGLSADS